MQLFKYILIDRQGKTRIGYMEGEDQNGLAARFAQAGAQKILSISTFQLANINLLDKRKIFSFAGARGQMLLEGSIEHLSDLDAYKELIEEYQIIPSVVVEGARELAPMRVAYEDMTRQLALRYQSIKKGKDIKEKTKEFFAPTAKKSPEQGAASIIDKDFKTLLATIKRGTENLLLDKTYADDIESIHTTIRVLLDRAATTHEQKYDFLSYILRELSFVEDTMDDSRLREDIKKLLTKCVHLLQKLETIKIQNTTKESKNPAPKVEQNIIFGTDAKNTTKTTSAPIKENQPVELSAFKKYQDKKELVKSLNNEIEQLRSREDKTEDNIQPLNFSSENLLLREVPKLTEILVLFYLLIVVAGESLLINKISLTLFSFNLTTLIGSVILSHSSLKLIFVFILFHAFLSYWKEYQTHKKSIFTAFSIFFISASGTLYFF